MQDVLRACDLVAEMLESSGDGALINMAVDSPAELLDGGCKRSYREQSSVMVRRGLRGGVCLKERVACDEILDISLIQCSGIWYDVGQSAFLAIPR